MLSGDSLKAQNASGENQLKAKKTDWRKENQEIILSCELESEVRDVIHRYENVSYKMARGYQLHKTIQDKLNEYAPLSKEDRIEKWNASIAERGSRCAAAATATHAPCSYKEKARSFRAHALRHGASQLTPEAAARLLTLCKPGKLRDPAIMALDVALHTGFLQEHPQYLSGMDTLEKFDRWRNRSHIDEPCSTEALLAAHCGSKEFLGPRQPIAKNGVIGPDHT